MKFLIAVAVAATATAVTGCASKPPDFSKIIGHTPEEVRDYLGTPKDSDPESEGYEIKGPKGETIPLGVIYRNGQVLLVVSRGPSLNENEWTEDDFREWFGPNCNLELETRTDTVGDKTYSRTSATVRGPCTPRVY